MFKRFTRVGSVAALTLAVCGCASSKSTPAAAANSAAASAVPAAGTAQPLASTGAQTAPARTTPAAALNAIPCAARDVTLKPGTDNGDFNGMSHSGTYLTLTNRSRTACSVPGLPQLTFLDANGPVQTAADLAGARFMHPGPAVLPIVLQPKQSITTGARWVSGPVFQDNLCYKLTGVTLALSDASTMAALTGQMCGERSKGVHYDLQRYSQGNSK